MCAGVTLFDPLRRYGAGPGMRVGVIGIGGLGVMGIKLAKALGCTVTAVTRGEAKAAFAKRCGADAVVLSSSSSNLAAAAGTIDLLLNTIPVEHDYMAYQGMLRKKGKQIMLGLNTGLVAGIAVDALVCGASRVKGSGIGGIEATQAVIDLCDEHKIYPEVELIPVEGVNRAYEQLDASNESGVRFVIDLASLNEEAFARCSKVPAPKLGPQPPPMGMGSIVGAILSLLCCCRWR
jgi:uncharacterized zinc-type alcohol dehydrogenase-like protein